MNHLFAHIALSGSSLMSRPSLLAAGLLLFAAAATAAAPAERGPPSIEVTANAQVDVPADLAVLDFGVVTQADTAAEAARQNRERMEAVLAAVRKAVGTDARLSTGTYALRPSYTSPRDGSAPRVSGYTASNVVQLKTADLPRLGQIIDLAIAAGANQVQRIAFTLKDHNAPRREALRNAVQQAREDANAIAAAIGVKLGPVYSVVEHDVGGARPLMRQAMAVSAESIAVTPVEPGLIEVRARVVLTVEIAR